MSWPDRVYRPQDPNADDMGMVDFVPPMSITTIFGIREGLPDDWQEYDDTVERVNAWEVLDNPLYEAAAGALDIDWDKFKENFANEIGDQDLYDRPDPPVDDTLTPIGNPNQGGIGGHTVSDIIDDDDDDDDEDEPYDWGITHEGIEGQLNEMQDWLLGTIGDAVDQRGYSGSGPSAADWGMEGDIWEIMGLTDPPLGPQPLAEDMFDYKDDPSNYDKLETYGSGSGHENPWITAATWLGENPNYAEEYPFRGEKGATHVMWDYQRAIGALTVPEPKGLGQQYDWYQEDRERNMPGNDLNPDVPVSSGNALGQGAWDNTQETTTEE
tara:strand:- start:364 stop:1341 length:978 start_codon:yes stop_codon:yes gene_type:complete